MITAGIMQIGWATKDSKFLNYVSKQSLHQLSASYICIQLFTIEH